MDARSEEGGVEMLIQWIAGGDLTIDSGGSFSDGCGGERAVDDSGGHGETSMECCWTSLAADASVDAGNESRSIAGLGAARTVVSLCGPTCGGFTLARDRPGQETWAFY